MNMSSNKPYLIRAIYDWIIDNNCTPHILVNTQYPGVEVPQEHVVNDRIVLNISPQACRGLHLDNDKIVFSARFSGISVQIMVLPAAVLAIYAKENGRGMEFGEEFHEPPPPATASTPSVSNIKSKSSKPALTLVKKE